MRRTATTGTQIGALLSDNGPNVVVPQPRRQRRHFNLNPARSRPRHKPLSRSFREASRLASFKTAPHSPPSSSPVTIPAVEASPSLPPGWPPSLGSPPFKMQEAIKPNRAHRNHHSLVLRVIARRSPRLRPPTWRLAGWFGSWLPASSFFSQRGPASASAPRNHHHATTNDDGATTTATASATEPPRRRPKAKLQILCHSFGARARVWHS